MKFSLAAAVFGLASLVSAQIDLSNPQEALKGQYVDPESMEAQPFKYEISYSVLDHQGTVLEIYYGEQVTLNYTFVNNEDEEVSIVGVGGHFANPLNGELIANITDSKLGPVVIPAGESRSFTQTIGVMLSPFNYVLNPGIYVVKGSTLAMLGAQSTLAIVSEKPVSFFAPELIVLELLLVATLAIGGYFFYVNFGAQYLKTAGMTATAQKASSPAAAASTGAQKTVDESWLPDHLKKSNKKKAN